MLIFTSHVFLLPGYEYDIFISYRQNDNRYDGWVTGSVSNLKAELEATMKGKVNVYFDETQKDRLLGKSQRGRVPLPKFTRHSRFPSCPKPIATRESFAWNQEFLAFLNIYPTI